MAKMVVPLELCESARYWSDAGLMVGMLIKTAGNGYYVLDLLVSHSLKLSDQRYKPCLKIHQLCNIASVDGQTNKYCRQIKRFNAIRSTSISTPYLVVEADLNASTVRLERGSKQPPPPANQKPSSGHTVENGLHTSTKV